MKIIYKSRVLTHLFIISLFFCLLPLTCSSAGPGDMNQKITHTNDLSRFLAGLPVSRESAFGAKTKSPFYKKHVRFMNAFWKHMHKGTILHIRPWQKKYLPVSLHESSTVFYPLSGADFINMFSLFPGSPLYIMIGLEKPGPPPAPLQLKSWQLKKGLSAIQRIISQYGRFNYFGSHAMHKEMSNAYLTGTTPVLMIFMTRMNVTIINVEQVGIDTATGKLHKTGKDNKINGKKPAVTGSRITFKMPEETHVRQLIYLQMYLNNHSVSSNSPSGKYLNSFSDMKTMLKSAVYLLHLKHYSGVKNFIMRKSSLIIQDDSGIPYTCLKNKSWDIKLFGKYFPVEVRGIGTITQKDLKRDYMKGSLQLPFQYGYGATLRNSKSNLLIAVKKN